ncbi:MAG: beta-lactamase family protein [Crocinitomicaceae bacterium]|nr:beta-lactamase family protein [Crocinitomicaceae bacterium]
MTRKEIISTFILLTAIFQVSGQNYIQTIDSQYESSKEDALPGFSITMIKKDSIICHRSFGFSDIKNKITLDQNTPLAIASCSKQFTAYCILLLEEEGKLNLTDDIRDYIPELPDYPYTIRIKHLLSHSSGIRDHIVMLGWQNRQKEKYYDFEGTLEALGEFGGLSFEPGTDFAYSNTGYVLLALIIERVSGIEFSEFASQRIFEKIGMSNTEFSFRRNTGSPNPYSYDWKKKKFKEFNHQEVNALGATGIYTTVSDFIKWDKFLHNPTKDEKQTVKRMFISDTLNNGRILNYNNGFKHRQFNGFRIVEHSGGWANYNFQYTIIPELGIRIIVGANNEYYYPIGISEKVLKAILPSDQAPFQNASNFDHVPTFFQNQYVCKDFSTCHIEDLGDQYSITGKNLYGAIEYPILKIRNQTVIDSSGNRLIFNLEDTSFIWYGGAYFNNPRTFDVNFAVDPLILAAHSGVFYSNELGRLKVKYNQKKRKFKVKTSFGSNPKVLSNENRLLRTDKDFDIIFVDENTISLGNSRVRVKFTRNNSNKR